MPVESKRDGDPVQLLLLLQLMQLDVFSLPMTIRRPKQTKQYFFLLCYFFLCTLLLVYLVQGTKHGGIDGQRHDAGHLLRGKGKAPGLLLREPHTLSLMATANTITFLSCWPRPHDERAPE